MSATAKENFSGPAPIIEAGKTASGIKFGDRKGSWSRWVIEAIVEKLKAENPALLRSIESLASGGTYIGDDDEHALVLAAMKEDPAFTRKVLKLIPGAIRGKRAA